MLPYVRISAEFSSGRSCNAPLHGHLKAAESPRLRRARLRFPGARGVLAVQVGFIIECERRMANQIDGYYYRCHLTKDNRLVGYRKLFAANDDDAIEQARKILATVSPLSLELWRGREYVAMLEADAPSRGPHRP